MAVEIVSESYVNNVSNGNSDMLYL